MARTEGGAATSAADASPPGAAMARRPQGRAWGLAVQLYSVRSRDSWGHGDLRDLAELPAGAPRPRRRFRLVDPLHAANQRPGQPVAVSAHDPALRQPALPAGRGRARVRNARHGGPGRNRRLAAPLRGRNSGSELIDRDAVWSAKSTALGLIYQVPRSPARQAEFERYRCREAGAPRTGPPGARLPRHTARISVSGRSDWRTHTRRPSRVSGTACERAWTSCLAAMAARRPARRGAASGAFRWYAHRPDQRSRRRRAPWRRGLLGTPGGAGGRDEHRGAAR